MRRRLGLCLLVAALIVPFQNCSPVRSGASSASQTGTFNNGTGHPYDGKPFVLRGGVCADGTDVSSRILVNSTDEAYLVRDNCAEITPPQPLTAADFTIASLSADQLVFRGAVYQEEIPVKVIPKLSTFYGQYTQPLRTENVAVYIIHLFTYDAATIQQLKNAGRTVICSMDVGYFEAGRPDSAAFTAADMDADILDTRSANVRAIMRARLDLAKSKGCDGVAMDAFETYLVSTRFPLTSATSIDYARHLASAARDRGLIPALHNAVDLAPTLSDTFDVAFVRQCFERNQCQAYQSFTDKNKAVFAFEFTAYSAAQCAQAKAASISLGYFAEPRNGTRFEPCP